MPTKLHKNATWFFGVLRGCIHFKVEQKKSKRRTKGKKIKYQCHDKMQMSKWIKKTKFISFLFSSFLQRFNVINSRRYDACIVLNY